MHNLMTGDRDGWLMGDGVPKARDFLSAILINALHIQFRLGYEYT